MAQESDVTGHSSSGLVDHTCTIWLFQTQSWRRKLKCSLDHFFFILFIVAITCILVYRIPIETKGPFTSVGLHGTVIFIAMKLNDHWINAMILSRPQMLWISGLYGAAGWLNRFSVWQVLWDMDESPAHQGPIRAFRGLVAYSKVPRQWDPSSFKPRPL